MFEAFVSIFSTRTALSGKPFRSPKNYSLFLLTLNPERIKR